MSPDVTEVVAETVVVVCGKLDDETDGAVVNVGKVDIVVDVEVVVSSQNVRLTTMVWSPVTKPISDLSRHFTSTLYVKPNTISLLLASNTPVAERHQ